MYDEIGKHPYFIGVLIGILGCWHWPLILLAVLYLVYRTYQDWRMWSDVSTTYGERSSGLRAQLTSDFQKWNVYRTLVILAVGGVIVGSKELVVRLF